MAGTSYPPAVRSVWNQAWTEARGIALAVLGVSIAFTLGAGTSPQPLIPQAKSDTVAQAIVPTEDTLRTDGDTITSDTMGLTLPSDSTASVAPIDSSNLASLTAAEIARQRNDSLSEARRRENARIDSIRNVRQTPTVPTPDAVMAQVATMKEIGTDVAKRVFDLHKAQWLDARSEAEFVEGHIPGAMNIYAPQWGNYIRQILEEIPDKEHQIVVYCGGGDCELSHDLATSLRGLGYKKVAVYTGGTTEWNAKNYPFVK